MATAPASSTLLMRKRHAQLERLALRSGAMLHDVTLGYETAGQLNAAGDNAVLVCHHFSGHSHAAGRYSDSDAAPGWWDAIIGPGKAIDTDRYFVVSTDALGCVRTDAPHGLTTGPASLDPATGKPYGPDFPALDVRDTVLAQRLLLEQLGVTRLAAVAGPSFGGIQALAWAASYPTMVERCIVAIGLAEFRAREIGLYHAMEQAIRLDPKFQNGRYDPKDPPLDGLALAIELMIVTASGSDELQEKFGRMPAPLGTGEWAIESWLAKEPRLRAKFCDANAWLAMLRTNMRWDLALGQRSMTDALSRLQARVLLIPAQGDQLLPAASYHDPLVTALSQAGVPFDVHALSAAGGHLAGLSAIAEASDAIRACLDAPRRA